jgi:hypothetical protein
MSDRDVVTVIQDYRVHAERHDQMLQELRDLVGESDAEQIDELLAAQKFIRMARTLIDSAVSRSEESSPAVQPAADRATQTVGQSPYFPVWRV